MNKVFGIGFHKTGTTTLESVLKELGYKVCGVKLELAKHLESNNWDPIWKMVEEYDAFQDNPWPLLYRKLYEKYPDGKFILTLRDQEKWLKSISNHFGDEPTDMRKWIYGVGSVKGNEEIFLNRYLEHNQSVKEFFKDKPGKLLVVSWEDGARWEEICSFLEKKVPNKPFPHANKGTYNRFGKTVKKLFKSILRVVYNWIYKS